MYFKQFIDTKKTSPETINNITVRFNSDKAIRLIKNYPILGIGIGDKKNKSIVKTEELPPGSLPEHVFDSHNQFLDFWIAAGIIPVICFLLFFIDEFSKAIRYKYMVYLGTGLLLLFILLYRYGNDGTKRPDIFLILCLPFGNRI